jgi:hypothetical protein
MLPLEWQVARLYSERMILRLAVLLSVVFALACERRTSTSATDTAKAVSQRATISPAAAAADSGYGFAIDNPDSSFGVWEQDAFVSGNHVRHPSGELIIWFDTAIRATEDHPVGRAHADSIVVSGLKHGEGLSRYCFIEGNPQNEVVGIVPDSTVVEPRLAWTFDKATLRIKAVPTDSLRCSLRDPLEGDEVD